VKDKLYAGFQLRKHELFGEKHYRLGEGGTYIPLPDATGSMVVMSINAAMAYSSQEFGRLRTVDAALHAVVKGPRDAFSTYASNTLRDLKAAVRALSREGKPRERAANLSFREALEAVFEAYDKRAKTAKDRGDTDADPVRYRVARDAFWKSYNAS